jgi:apolipoprotein N-acyltransferase
MWKDKRQEGQARQTRLWTLWKQVAWNGIDAVLISGMYVRIVFILFACWIAADVDKLVFEVVGVSYAVLMIAAVPDFSCGLLTGCEGVATFDVLNAFCC